MTHTDNSSGSGGKPGRGGRREVTTVQAALRPALAPVMRQIRKFTAMGMFLSVMAEELPAELEGLVAPHDVRLAPSREPGQDGGVANVNTLYLYVASATVGAVLEKRKRALIAEVNKRLKHEFIEELRYDEVGQQKIARQLNILRQTPDL
jgi:hypothetical protein